MNSLDTLYFPGTAIISLRQYPIFLLFQNLLILSPVESDPIENGKESPDSFIKSGFCQVDTPCPLGTERNRFLRLVEDIKTRKDDYSAQLSTLTIAAMTAGAGQDEETERSITRSLFPTSEHFGETREKQAQDKLWQARLILAIGELLDHEEEEIALNMAILEEEEKELFNELQGEEDGDEEGNPFEELARLRTTSRSSYIGNVKKRFEAWKALFLAGTSKNCEVFLTSGQEQGDLLLDMYQERTGQPPLSVARFNLPTFIGWNSGEACITIRDFTTRHLLLLKTIEEQLQALIHHQPYHSETADRLAALSSDWDSQLATDFPEEQFGRVPVSFYLLPGYPCATLLGKTADGNNTGNNGLLAIIG
ncbi:MAG: hypothetical protein OEL83_20420 [Desulforhopalus sp.]|nr:hypothetical protein [Desulforhopalus sp.]